MNHLTDFEIQEYISRLAERVGVKGIEDHVRTCAECSERVAGFRRLERELRKVPPERTARGFTVRVMRAAGLQRTPGLMKQLFVNLLPLAGAGLIVVLLVGVFSSPEETGPLAGEAGRYAESFQQTMGRTLSAGSFIVAEWARKVVVLFASMPSVKFVLWILVAFVAVAIFDELIFVPMMKKKG